MMNDRPDLALIFDLDGTLLDSVYHHTLAWAHALDEASVVVPLWRLHRKIGMGGSLFTRALLRELGQAPDAGLADRLREAHGRHYRAMRDRIRPLPGAGELLAEVVAAGCATAVATSSPKRNLDGLYEQLAPPSAVRLVTADDVAAAKPSPALFQVAMAQLACAPGDCLVVGDSVWDVLAARRAGALAIGLRCGGYGDDELTRAGACRLYDDPAHLRKHLHELGIQG
ncbi:MAG: HAD family hydrolase [Pseudomonadota bacterium]|nr:HAD family hydrolase [Pseudomonadota bacterium]